MKHCFDHAIKGVTMLHVLDDMGAYEAIISKDLDRYLPFLSTTTLLMESVQRGAGREQAHEAIKEHALKPALAMREQGLNTNDLAKRLAADDRIPLDEHAINGVLSRSRNLTGLASQQVEEFVRTVEDVTSHYPEAHTIEKGRLL
jgi:adenylosuccinate lyase